MSTQPSNFGASPVETTTRKDAQVARIKRVYAPVPVRTRAPASNDHLYSAAAGAAEANDAWARRAASANGFGDAAVDGAPSAQPRSGGVALKARDAAQAGLGEILAALADAFVSNVREMKASWKRARDGRATLRALEGLDARTLQDIGFARSEASSVAAELAGGAPLSRIRTLMTLRDLSI